MRRSLLVIFAISTSLVFLFSHEGKCYVKKNLYNRLSDAKEVKIYVAKVIDSSGAAGDMLTSFRKSIEDALATRMTINFMPVSSKDDADIVITCSITERIWMKEAPLGQVRGLGAAVIGIDTITNYARIQAFFAVERGGKKVFLKGMGRIFRRRRIAWREELQATITKQNMTEKESIPLLEDRIVKIFMRKCFSKNAKSL